MRYFLLCLLLTGCASQAPTSEQIAAYRQLLHQGVQDYKVIRDIQLTHDLQ